MDKTILFHDKDNNGKINFEEFCEVHHMIIWLAESIDIAMGEMGAGD